jgi:hypothetical protein
VPQGSNEDLTAALFRIFVGNCTNACTHAIDTISATDTLDMRMVDNEAQAVKIWQTPWQLEVCSV